jgi:hypothetical protein
MAASEGTGASAAALEVGDEVMKLLVDAERLGDALKRE